MAVHCPPSCEFFMRKVKERKEKAPRDGALTHTHTVCMNAPRTPGVQALLPLKWVCLALLSFSHISSLGEPEVRDMYSIYVLIFFVTTLLSSLKLCYVQNISKHHWSNIIYASGFFAPDVLIELTLIAALIDLICTLQAASIETERPPRFPTCSDEEGRPEFCAWGEGKTKVIKSNSSAVEIKTMHVHNIHHPKRNLRLMFWLWAICAQVAFAKVVLILVCKTAIKTGRLAWLSTCSEYA